MPSSCLRLLTLLALLSAPWLLAIDDRLSTNAPPKDLNTPRTFPTITSRKEWQARARDIREQVLVSCGLWPMPEKTPLNARIFGKIERDGYSIEKVYFEALPGYYVGGNLYRPRGQGKGPFPGILNPHGHWAQGRLADTKDGSVVARCIGFARHGMVAFAYDMHGFNDTHFAGAPTDRPFYEIHRQFGARPADQLWNISLMGLQNWNSIRALDFLAGLPDVDRKRLACTGASGGGTQTYMLGPIDDRLAAQAPVVMVSHTMQGGCSCENAPGLRVEYSNMEIAAAAAPRPQLLVAATGDWTKDTLTVEGPALAHIYELLKAPSHLRYVRFDFGHNYNQTSREAVYDWFGHWLLKKDNLKEAPYEKEPDADLRVFPDGQLPENALTQEQALDLIKQRHREQYRALLPHDKESLVRFKEVMMPLWQHTLQVGWPAGVPAGGVRDPAFFAPAKLRPFYPPDKELMVRTSDVIVSVTALPIQQGGSNQFANFFSTYNRTEIQKQVRNLIAACAHARIHGKHIVLQGTGRAGLWALLAAPDADAVIADCSQLNPTDDEALLAPDLFCPGLRNLGAFEGAALLAAPHPLLLHNVGPNFPTETLRSLYQALGAASKLRIESRCLSDGELSEWAARNR
jgi:hypothetical protein